MKDIVSCSMNWRGYCLCGLGEQSAGVSLMLGQGFEDSLL
jgi:hypothetical protein